MTTPDDPRLTVDHIRDLLRELSLSSRCPTGRGIIADVWIRMKALRSTAISRLRAVLSLSDRQVK
jgi:hypothetical protein